jgi:hypothetical protein
MFINTQKSVFSRMAVELGRRSKDIIAIAGDRDSAEAAAMSIRDEVEFRDNIQTGALLNSINVVPIGGGDFAVKAIDYGKYVNGYQREVDGAGFIDDGVTAAQIDGYDVDVVI